MLEDVTAVVMLIFFFLVMPALCIYLGWDEFVTAMREKRGPWPKSKLAVQVLVGFVVGIFYLIYVINRWDEERAFVARCRAQDGASYFRIHSGDTEGLREYCVQKFDSERWPF